MNEQQWQEVTQRLAGIELPPEPDWWPWIALLAGLIVAALIAIAGLYRARRRQRSARPEAIQRLQRLQQAWQAGQLPPRDAAYQLATLLRLGLGLRQLAATPPPALAGQETQWRDTLELLRQLRYQPHSQARLSPQTFRRVQAWLRQGQPPC